MENKLTPENAINSYNSSPTNLLTVFAFKIRFKNIMNIVHSERFQQTQNIDWH